MQMSGNVPNIITETPRLVIRQLSLDDLDSLYSIYDSWGPVQGVEPLSPNRDEEREKLESYIHFMYGFYGLGLWAVVDKESGRMIGRCGAWPSQVGDDWLPELGYVIQKDFCRQGMALEAMEAIVAYIRKEKEFTCAAARIHKENKVSLRLAQKLGMKPDARFSPDEDGMCVYRLDLS